LLLSPLRALGREIIHEKANLVKLKITFGDLWLMLRIGGFDSRDNDSEMMGKPRAIAAIEPIKGDTVFVADSVGRVYG
jgi:hypothetical protein